MCHSLVAYIDPGSGSILLQVILAALVGSISLFYRRIVELVGAVFRRRTAQAPPVAHDQRTPPAATSPPAPGPTTSPGSLPDDGPAGQAP